MKFGMPMMVGPRNWVTFTQEAEEAGFESVWLPEHLIMPVEMHGHPGRGMRVTSPNGSVVAWWGEDLRVSAYMKPISTLMKPLRSVDLVTIFADPTPREVIARMLPDVLVKGADWGPTEIVGREEVEAAGGRVVSIPVTPGFSTSALVEAAKSAGR